MKFEICIDSVEAAIAAQEAGAHRVELCDNLVEGGTTPSAGTARIARKSVGIDINFMIRPRGSDFYYSDLEFQVMKQDIQIAKDEGMNGVVLGLLLPDGRIDVERTQELVELARPLSVTFHRAFDVSRDPFESMAQLKKIGVNRILTGGHTFRAVDGLDCLAELVQKAGEQIIILVCGGVNASNVSAIVKATHPKEIHFASRKNLDSPMTYRLPEIFMGANYHPDEYSHKVTSADLIRKVIQAAG